MTIEIFNRTYTISDTLGTALYACNQGANTATYARLVNADIEPERLYGETAVGALNAFADAMLIHRYSAMMRTERGKERAIELADWAVARM